MPCFHVHWLVAIEVLGAEPKYIKTGYQEYMQQVKDFNKIIVYDNLKDILDRNSEDEARKFSATVKTERENFDRRIIQSEFYDDITCFSAYTLGACGPDFWMCPSIPSWGPLPDFGDKHFDLGHYNRTHRQFEVAIKRLKNANKNSLQSKVEMSYFLGMATHIAADLIIHQLVNVSAGAYNLLEKLWENENGHLWKNIFNTHNKVEHYWDTYIRYRYLGDRRQVFGINNDRTLWDDYQNWVEPFGILTLETLLGMIDLKKNAKIAKTITAQLKEDNTRLNLELPFIFPRVFADRMIAGDRISPFIYDVVVNKSTGAYPTKDIASTLLKDAEKEASHYQMEDKKAAGGHSERKKVAWFSTKENTEGYKDDYVARAGSNMNYLTYIACPDIERVHTYGPDLFYNLNALGPFINSGIQLASRFLQTLRNAFNDNSTNLSELGNFWNLDTGLGLNVESISSKTVAEVITRLDFVHAFDLSGMDPLNKEYKRNPNYIHKGKKDPTNYQTGWDKKYPFNAYHNNPFPSINEVEESSTAGFLKTIPIKDGSPARAPEKRDISTFFGTLSGDVCTCEGVPTGTIKEENKILAANIKHRLTLAIRVPIADTETAAPDKWEETLGFFLWGDQALKLDKSLKEEPSKWIKDKKTKCIDYSERPVMARKRLQFFTTELLFNLEKDKDLKREIKKGKWNNVIPYSDAARYYGRNFAVGTGRTNVLNPIGSGNFNPNKDFAYYTNVSPTEQVFFSLYLLVNTPDGCFDMISKEPVTASKLEELRKMESVGVVKIVLFYFLDYDQGAMYLQECYIDGLPVKVNNSYEEIL